MTTKRSYPERVRLDAASVAVEGLLIVLSTWAQLVVTFGAWFRLCTDA